MTAVRFSLPAGYSLATHGRGYVFTAPRDPAAGASGLSTFGADVKFADDATGSPFPTPGAAVRAIIEHAGLVGAERDALLAEVARLPGRYR